MRRRAFIGLGAAGLAAAVVGPYLGLLLPNGVENAVADMLDVTPAFASKLLATVRRQYGQAEYERRVVEFAIAAHDPWRAALPAGVRQRGLLALLGPMMENSAAGLAYVARGGDPAPAACNGLRRPA
ncbi:MAG TPA: hypothetical protein VGN78_05505 [Solirubrobacteraceae bacterium]|jgi:hypothetical protein|nr:hypothetical protein [Solirubrobacteraceae bacterium]